MIYMMKGEWLFLMEEERTKLAMKINITMSKRKQAPMICFQLRHFLNIQWISFRPYQIWTYLYHISIINWE